MTAGNQNEPLTGEDWPQQTGAAFSEQKIIRLSTNKITFHIRAIHRYELTFELKAADRQAVEWDAVLTMETARRVCGLHSGRQGIPLTLGSI